MIACFLVNIFAEHYHNRFLFVKVIGRHKWGVFDTVYMCVC